MGVLLRDLASLAAVVAFVVGLGAIATGIATPRPAWEPVQYAAKR